MDKLFSNCQKRRPYYREGLLYHQVTKYAIYGRGCYLTRINHWGDIISDATKPIGLISVVGHLHYCVCIQKFQDDVLREGNTTNRQQKAVFPVTDKQRTLTCAFQIWMVQT